MAIQPTALSPTQAHYMSGLTIEQFNGLFEKNISPEALASLAESAGDGNLNSIDLLHNIALRQDSAGKNAENILFDLFSGKRSAVKGIDKEIQKTSQVLYQSQHHREVFKHPSKLLYIIGSTLEKLDDKIELTNLFVQNLPPVLGNESNLWGNNRMITCDEIDSSNKNNPTLPSNMMVNSPIGLIQSGDNLLAEIIEQKAPESVKLKQFELFPINVNDNHWVLFVLYQADPIHQPADNNQSANNKRKCILFNSYDNVSTDIRKEITVAAKKADVAEEDITYIEGNIQQQVPNGCGLFVVEAIKQLTENTQQDPYDTLKEFQEIFIKKTMAEQKEFNIQNRRQLYSNYHDSKYPSL